MKLAKIIILSLIIVLWYSIMISVIALQRGQMIAEQQKTIGELEKQQLELQLLLIQQMKGKQNEKTTIE